MIDEQFAPLGVAERMRAIAEYDVFDPELRARLDAVCSRTAAELSAPAALVSIVLDSAQVVAGAHGLSGLLAVAGGSPVEWAFCSHAVLNGADIYVVPDATADPRHRGSPLVVREGVRAYAGAPVRGVDGEVLGMHCVLATSPRTFPDDQLLALRRAAAEISALVAAYRVPDRIPA